MEEYEDIRQDHYESLKVSDKSTASLGIKMILHFLMWLYCFKEGKDLGSF